MNNESLVHSLYKFIREGVTVEKMCESKIKSYKLNESLNEAKCVKCGKNFDGKSASKGGLCPECYKKTEGKLPKDPSKIEDPNGDVQLLAEKEKKVTQKSAEKEADAAVNKDIETAGAGKTEEPELTDLQKEAAKETPVDKLTQNKDGEDPLKGEPKVKEEKKITPEVTGVEKVKEQKINGEGLNPDQAIAEFSKQIKMGSLKFEDLLNAIPRWKMKSEDKKRVAQEIGKLVGKEVPKVVFDAIDQYKDIPENKLPDDPSQIKDPTGDIEKLSEEKVLTTVSDEKVAKDISLKYPGSRIVADKTPDGKNQFIVMVKESLTPPLTVASNIIKSEDGKFIVGWVGKNEKGIPQTYIKSFVSETEAQQFQDQMNKRVVKEDIDVTVKADGEEINVTSTPDGIQATKVNPEVQPIDRVETGVEVAEEEPDFYEGEEEWSEEEAGEMEEKIALSAHLGTLEKLTEKQKKFKDEVDGKKIGKKNKAKLKKK